MQAVLTTDETATAVASSDLALVSGDDGVEAWEHGILRAAVRIEAAGSDADLRLWISHDAFRSGYGRDVLHHAIEMAGFRGARVLHITGKLGSSEVLAALRAELPAAEVHAAGATWILTAQLADVRDRQAPAGSR